MLINGQLYVNLMSCEYFADARARLPGWPAASLSPGQSTKLVVNIISIDGHGL